MELKILTVSDKIESPNKSTIKCMHFVCMGGEGGGGGGGGMEIWPLQSIFI